MIKELIDLQKNSKATCAIIKNEDITNLSPSISMKAKVSDKFLFSGNKPPFADKINDISRLNDICYFIIMGIDDVSTEEQNRYVGLIKDREMNGYFLPNNCIIVLTVKNKDSLRKVSAELNHFAVVAI